MCKPLRESHIVSLLGVWKIGLQVPWLFWVLNLWGGGIPPFLFCIKQCPSPSSSTFHWIPNLWVFVLAVLFFLGQRPPYLIEKFVDVIRGRNLVRYGKKNPFFKNTWGRGKIVTSSYQWEGGARWVLPFCGDYLATISSMRTGHVNILFVPIIVCVVSGESICPSHTYLCFLKCPYSRSQVVLLIANCRTKNLND